MSLVSNLKYIFIIIWVGLTLSFAINVIANNLTATDGAKLNSAMEERKRLELENAALKAELARRQSLREIQQKARGLGFGPIRKIEHIPNFW